MDCNKLPNLPGLAFEDRFKRNHHVPQSFCYNNGFRVYRTPSVGIGQEPLKEIRNKEFCASSEPIEYDPALTYGRTKQQYVAPFRPHFVVYDKKTLKFMGFFRQHVPDSHIEHYRTRSINIFYYLEDDTVTVLEPLVKNCGFSQGRLVRRGRILKDSSAGIYWSWKDFNVGVDIELNGIVFHITDCDAYTRQFLEASGIEVNEREVMPRDPVAIDKMIQQAHQRHHHKTPSNDDKLRRFLNYSGMVLCFDCVLDETDRPGGELITFKFYYYLEDDTVAIKELPENQQGRDGFALLLKRTKLPKNWQKKPSDFPAIIFNISDAEIEEFYQPRDLIIGQTIFVFGRKFLLLDCDKFTRKYYDQVLRCPQGERLEIKKPSQPEIKIKLPEYLGLGTFEDSLASCYNLVPKPPKKDVITYLINANKMLRYGCRMDTAHPEEADRKFIINYNLADGMMSIIELAVPNSGIAGGKFLSSRKIVKPDSNPNRPDYYTPKDLYIGALVKVFAHRFIITSADLYVYRYMQAHPELFSPDVIDSIRLYHLKEGNLKQDLLKAIEDDHQQYLLQQVNKQKSIGSAMEDTVPDEPTTERLPCPFITENEVKLDYHERKATCEVPCNINIKEDYQIPSDKCVVRFLEQGEK